MNELIAIDLRGNVVPLNLSHALASQRVIDRYVEQWELAREQMRAKGVRYYIPPRVTSVYRADGSYFKPLDEVTVGDLTTADMAGHHRLRELLDLGYVVDTHNC